jgi:hypothetical protein
MQTYLLDAGRVGLDQHTEPSEGRVLLVVILDLPEGGAPTRSNGLGMSIFAYGSANLPGLGKVSQVRSDRSRRNKTHSTDGDRGVLAQTAGAA